VSGWLYLDWNATAPLRPEARAAMLAAMALVGNPSSVHAEGRAARAAVETARAQVAEATGCLAGEVVFTSGATEGAALALGGRGFEGAAVEHPCVAAWIAPVLPVDRDGRVAVRDPARSVLQAANGETGVVQALPSGLACIDAAQAVGRIPFGFDWTGARTALVSSAKLGGPKGTGALLLAPGEDPEPRLRGGGQERGRRAGTENILGIVGMGAAAAAAVADLASGRTAELAALRDLLEEALASAAPDLIFFGKGAPRLGNTSAFALPGWRSETQVMQMDLAGFAVSAGSACSSGKIRPSGVLTAMGYGPEVATSALRVSIGPGTPREGLLAFAAAWERQYRRFRARAA
jgi:cysteine desulfurase